MIDFLFKLYVYESSYIPFNHQLAHLLWVFQILKVWLRIAHVYGNPSFCMVRLKFGVGHH